MNDDNAATTPAPKKKCFVVMGFGKKPDYATGRTLDLDGTYESIIKRAVEDAGLECIRADGIIHSGIIDRPMYQMLYAADLVVADLSTSNANAIYELGVRHALKPGTTIVIAESQFKFPFDLHSLLIRQYTHLGDGVDFREANRMYGILKDAIEKLTNENETDSPVYTFLPTLSTPVLKPMIDADQLVPPTPAIIDNSSPVLLELFKEARQQENWFMVISCLKKLLLKMPTDSYLKQQLALATYKYKKPTLEEALKTAKEILEELNPSQTTDPETLGLWGAVYKRMWEVKTTPPNADINAARPDLDEAIWGYEKGFYLKNDHYNGINFAYLLNVRASISVKREAIADIVNAERIRKKLIGICTNILNKQTSEWGQPLVINDPEQKFWVQATLVEAYLGTGDKDASDKLKATIIAGDENWKPESWMINTMNEQLDKLSKLLENAPDCN